jgi:uncharacterized protein
MFLPCIDGHYDKSIWGGDWLYPLIQANRTAQNPSETISFWPLADAHAAGPPQKCVLSGIYVQQWSQVAQRMAEQGSNSHPFTGKVTLSSFWSDFNTRPMDYFRRIPDSTPVLWIMATEDVVCGPLEWTKGVFEKEFKGSNKEVLVLEGEHLPQYFDPGFGKSVEGMLDFLRRYAK